MTQPDTPDTRHPGHPTPRTPDTPDTHDARTGSGDPETEPAAPGEKQLAEPDADGGAVPEGADR